MSIVPQGTDETCCPCLARLSMRWNDRKKLDGTRTAITVGRLKLGGYLGGKTPCSVRPCWEQS